MSERVRLPVLTRERGSARVSDSPGRRARELPPRPLITIVGSEADTHAFVRALLRSNAHALALLVGNKADARAFEDLLGTVSAPVALVIMDEVDASEPLGFEALPEGTCLLGLGRSVLERWVPSFTIGLGALGMAVAPVMSVREQGEGAAPQLWLSDASELVAAALGVALGLPQ